MVKKEINKKRIFIKLNNNIIYEIYLNLPFGEQRTETEIRKALKDDEHPEHDYLKSLYLNYVSNKYKGGVLF